MKKNESAKIKNSKKEKEKDKEKDKPKDNLKDKKPKEVDDEEDFYTPEEIELLDKFHDFTNTCETSSFNYITD